MVTPAMFIVLAGATCVLLIVILIATSRSKSRTPASKPTLYPNSGRGTSRPASRYESNGTVRPRVRQGLDSKAVVKATVKNISFDGTTAADLKPLTDRKLQPLASPSALESAEVVEGSDASHSSVPDVAAPAPMNGVVAQSQSAIPPNQAADVLQITAQEPPVVNEVEPVVCESVCGEHASPTVAEISEAAGDVSPDIAENSEVPSSLVKEGDAANAAASFAERALEIAGPPGAAAESGKETPAPSLLAFYGLRQQPFDVTPDPSYLYRSRVHREALAALSQGIENLRGFVALVAEPGMGKTTLLNKLMEELGDSARIVFLFQTQCNSHELLRHLLTELGVEHDGMDTVAMHKALSHVVFEEMMQGRRFVLIVDEAQNLQDSVLETIRLLSNYETTHSKMIQIVLAGQPQLVDSLMRPGLVQLRQRIAVLANLEALDVTETAAYIEHRLRAAGSDDMPIFTREAMETIALRSEGIPRSINNICFNAMLAGYMNRQLMIDAEIVKRVASDLDLELLVRRPQQELAGGPTAPSNELSQLANLLSTALAVRTQPEMPAAMAEKNDFRNSLSLTGRLNEKITSQSWSDKNEFQIQVSLERDYLPGIPIADHYYCRSFYVSEEQAKSLEPGKAVRVKFEQD